MGFFDRFRFRNKDTLEEDYLRPKVTPVPSKNDDIGLSDDKDDITEIQMESDNSVIDSSDIDKFTTLSKYRDERYAGYEDLLRDPVISAALEMYADDATQMNRDGNVIWVESDDQTIADAGNRLISVLGIDKYVWKHIYSLCTYGDLYLRLYKEGDIQDDAAAEISDTDATYMSVKPDDKIRKLEERVEYVYNPATVFDIQSKDKTTGFIRLKSKPTEDSTTTFNREVFGGFSQPVSVLAPNSFSMLNNKSYVHISLSESINRFPQMVVIKNDDGEISNAYQIKVGKSILEDAYSASRQIQLLKDSLMLNRLTKSALVRIIQIQVGDSPEPEVKRKVQRFKAMLEQKMSVNTETGSARSYNNPGPMENIIYTPVRGEQGAVSETTIGGDVNVKDIIDIEFFQNQQLAALKIPKQYLNFDSAEGFSNGTSLIKQSSRYAHTVMRIQNAYIQGITTLLNIFFIDKGLEYVNKFTVKMVSPSTAEDSERDEQLTQRVNQVQDIMSLFDDYDADTKHKVFKTLVSDLLQIPGLSEIMNQIDDEAELQAGDEADSDGGFDNFNTPHSSGGFSGGDFEDDFDLDRPESGGDFDLPPEDTMGDDFGDEIIDVVSDNT